MAELLKNIFSPEFIRSLHPHCIFVDHDFPFKRFERTVFSEQWEQLELKQRMKHIAKAFASVLPGNYPEQLTFFLKLTNKLLAEKVNKQGIEYMFITEFIELYGISFPELSLKAMETVTQLNSCEFAVRPFLNANPKAVLALLLQLAHSQHDAVRRFASEGCRPLLPWGMAVPYIKQNPSLTLPVLELLKNDPSEYVRKSVANHLNDISKLDASLVLNIAKQWKDVNENTNKMLKHGLRTLLKKGNNTALALFHMKQNISCSVSEPIFASTSIHIGEETYFSFSVLLEGGKKEQLRIVYTIDYIKKNGSTSGKVFFISEFEAEPGKRYEFKKKLSFLNRTTRIHYPGLHQLTISINGIACARAGIHLYE